MSFIPTILFMGTTVESARLLQSRHYIKRMVSSVSFGEYALTSFLELLCLRLHLKLILLRKGFGKFFKRFSVMTNEQKRFLQIETARMELNLMPGSGLYCRLRIRVKCSNVVMLKNGV